MPDGPEVPKSPEWTAWLAAPREFAPEPGVDTVFPMVGL
jgi:hypothetical protein